MVAVLRASRNRLSAPDAEGLFSPRVTVGAPAGRGAPAPPAGAEPPGLSYAHIGGTEQIGEQKQGAAPGQFVLTVPTNAGCCRLREVSGDRPRPTEKARGEIQGFSRGSRQRLLEESQSLDRSKIEQSWFVSNTVPAAENSWKKMRRWLKSYRERLQDKWGRVGWCAHWKKEPHESGGANHLLPHLHLMIHWLKGHPVPSLKEFRDWNDGAWSDVVDSVQKETHRRVGCRVERLRSWNGVAFYVSKYFGKLVADALKNVQTGRIWGRINDDQFPITREEQTLSPEVGKKARRILRKLQERKRRFWLTCESGRWVRVRYTKCSYDGENWRWLNPDEYAARLKQFGRPVKLVRVKSVRTKEVQIWAQEIDGYKLSPVSTEKHSHCSSLHFVQSATVRRLVELLERHERAKLAPEPPDDGIPF